ncbi:PAS domain S-box protein [Coralloluteibacterium stylophorae]|uniref:histidine kinase n=1 Tax=Coralloluteibacterium stylophorae TaxID=1776034 RepID=A0A8J7VRV5_9GAMM|nr:PAS domain S-box protein [Coralloluteibacterium stylophorae]MBS7458589.1 PAS domain S-box protein [Coralloluteibacterium stylophorae]
MSGGFRSDHHNLPFLRGGGECGAVLRALDWAANPLGPPQAWPQSLKTLVGVAMDSSQPMLIVWGPEQITLYNDGYAAMCGERHPRALGRPYVELWHDIWDEVEPILSRAYAGESTHMDDIAFVMHRNGYPEQTHFAFGYTPVQDDAGGVVGMFCACTETTQTVRAAKREAFRTRLQERLRSAEDPQDILGAAAGLLGTELDAGRVGYGELDAGGAVATTTAHWVRPPMPAPAASYRLEAYADALGPRLARGQALVVHDTERDPGLDAGRRAAFAAAGGVRATLCVPLVKAGRASAVLYVDDHRPRRWSDEDESLTRDVLERTWAAVERARAEQARRETERDLRFTLAAGRMGAWSQDLASGELHTSAIFRANFGHPEDAPFDRITLLASVHPDDVEGVHQAMTQSVASGEDLDCEFRVVARDGEVRWVGMRGRPSHAADGTPLRMTGICLDITTRRRTEAALRESEERYRQIVEGAEDFAILTLDDRRIITSWNTGAERMLGYAEAEVLGRSGDIFFTAEDIAAGEPEREQRTAQTRGRALNERWHQRKDGSRFWGSGLMMRRPQGGVLKMFRDRTAEHEAEAALRRLNETLEERVEARTRELQAVEEHLRQAQKMEAVGQLTGGIAHDFNNMLTGVIGGLDIVRARLASGRHDDVQRFLDAASQSAQRAANLTQRLLAFSRRQSLNPVALDINGLVRGMRELLSRTLGENVALDFAFADALWPVRADENQLESTLLNLAINARDAMPGGGTLRIATCNVDVAERDARLAGARAGEYVLVEVADTGVGMSAELLERVFEPFFTTKPIGQGTGLGLSMIYGFAKQSEGHVDIESREGEGTTIRLFLPRADATAVEAAVAGAPVHAAADGAGEVVLVVEDEPSVRLLILEALEELGYAHMEAASADAALPLLQSDRRIDLLVTDVGLPGMNGRQLAEAARSARPGLGVLFVTGYAAEAANRERFLEPGMDMITKPFSMSALGERIRAMIERRAS